MFTNDPLSDFLARIRNAQQRKKELVLLPASKLLESVSQILTKEGFIESYKVIDQQPQNTLEIKLKYVNGEPAIIDLKRQSKPGVRTYIKADEIKKVRNGFGISILSTNKGLVTGKQARALGIGGELLCTIW